MAHQTEASSEKIENLKKIKSIMSSLGRILIIGGALAPDFNESMANQIHLLSRTLGIQVLTFNDLGLRPFKRMGLYLIINSRFVINRTPILSFINGIVIYMIIKIYERKFDTLIIAGGIESVFMKYLNLKKCVPIVTSIPFINDNVNNKILKLSQKLKLFIAQSKKTKDQLIKIGVNPNKIILMPPLVDSSKFRYSDPPPLNEFKILFASSPNLEVPGEDNFRDKGLPLLLEAFKEFTKNNNAKLYIVWRGKYNKKLFQKIDELNLREYVKIINGVVNMPEMYSKTHVTIIPYLNLWRSPELPMSALESLLSGRPVITTDVGEIARIVASYKCGSICKPTKEGILSAMNDCQKNYLEYQKNCRKINSNCSFIFLL